MLDTIIQKIMAFTNSRYIQIISKAFMAIAAVSIAGSLFNLLASLPIQPWLDFLESSGLKTILSVPADVANNLVAVFVVVAMAYETAKSFGENPFPVSIVSLCAFMILTPFEARTRVITETGDMIVGNALNVLSVSSLGAQGIFLAMIVGILAARIYIMLIQKNVKVVLPNSVPSAVSQMFETMIPGGITFLVFVVARFALMQTPFGTAQALIYGVVQAPLMGVGGGIGGAIAYLLFGKLLWVFGVHGDMVAYSAMGSITAAAQADNMAAFAAGTPAPYPQWVLVYIVMNLGALALLLDLLIFGKSIRYRETAKVAIAPAIFNITEPVVFGLPIIMNPITAVPFVLVPVINLIVCLGAQAVGLLAPMTGVMNGSVIPAPIALALANSSWTGAVWGVILILLDMVIFFPFVKVLDKTALKEEQENTEAEAA